MVSFPRDRRQAPAKGVGVIEGVGIIRDIGVKILRIFSETPLVGPPSEIRVPINERVNVSVSMMVDDVDVDI